MKSRPAIAQYEATVVLVVISLSLASVVYAGLRQESRLDTQQVFVNEETSIGGSPAIERVEVNSSSVGTISSFSVDGTSSTGGILAFDGSSYSTSKSLCAAGSTTFFSVLSSRPGAIEVATNGESWISGTWGSAVSVSPGWQEVMIQDGTSCSISLPDGQETSAQWSPSLVFLSSIPVEGALTGSSFTFYLPSGGSPHHLVLTSSGGFDDVAF
jgi:hypothetical protein